MADDGEPRRSLGERIRARWSHNNESNEKQHQDDRAEKFTVPELSPIELVGYLTTTKTRLLSPSIAEDLRHLLPARLGLIDQWNLLYSLEQHGSSLQTLYANNTPREKKSRSGYVLVIKDDTGHVFGAYTNEHFHPSDSRRFYGNGECFLWRTRILKDGQTRFEAFPYTGLNDFVIYCTHKFLSLGGGDGHYGLWIDDDLIHGVSSQSLTFGNEVLAGSNKFRIIGIEVWRIG